MLKKILTILLVLIFINHVNTLFAQVLETEESKPICSGQFEAGTGVEFQYSKEQKCVVDI